MIENRIHGCMQAGRKDVPQRSISKSQTGLERNSCHPDSWVIVALRAPNLSLNQNTGHPIINAQGILGVLMCILSHTEQHRPVEAYACLPVPSHHDRLPSSCLAVPGSD